MQKPLFIGSNGYVCAIDPSSGTEIWRTKLQEGMLKATAYQDVSVVVREGVIYAGSQGHLFALDAGSGRVLWHNPLKGLGFNDISIAFEGVSVQYIQKEVRSNSGSSNS
jgi:outer membrane protein assembly factor BamB